MTVMRLTVEARQEESGHWSAWVWELPTARAQGRTRAEALTQVQAQALRILADRVATGGGLSDIAWCDAADEIRRRQEIARQVDELRERLYATYGEMPDSTPLIREDRER